MNRNAAALAHALRAALVTLSLGATCYASPVPVTRSSLDGFDVLGAGRGLDAGEAADAVATMPLRGRVGAALAQAGAALRASHGLAGRFSVAIRAEAYGVEAAYITLHLDGPTGAREEREAMATVVYYLREALLGAAQQGRLGVRVVGL
jgi:hypothetical protein